MQSLLQSGHQLYPLTAPVRHHRLCRRQSKFTCSATQQSTEQSTKQTTAKRRDYDRIAKLSATVARTIEIPEEQKPLAEYMALPASQYSVLDANRIERISDDTFRCYVGGLKFFTWTVEPVLTVSVVTQERGCTIRLLSCELQGSQAFQDLNERFAASMTNVVRWQEGSGEGWKQIASDTIIEVELEVPRWSAAMPVESVGSSVMQTTLNLMVPRFLKQLQRDYQKWASGDTSRKPLGNGEL